MPYWTPISNFSPGQIKVRPIVTILDELTADELSRLAIEVVRENRRRLEETQSLFEQIEELIAADTEDDDLRHSYRLALLGLKVHHELVRIVIDTLGYVPEMPPDSDLH